jgi:hypothetical protein
LADTAANPGWRKSSHSGNGGGECVEVGTWRKSSHSGNGGGDCVEISSARTGVLVRDTTNRAGTVVALPAAAWRTLLASLRAVTS